MIILQLDFPAQLPCLLHIAMCSALCNESTLQYHPDKGKYEKIGESTEVALRVFAEKVCICMFLCVSYFYVVNVVCEATLGLKVYFMLIYYF